MKISVSPHTIHYEVQGKPFQEESKILVNQDDDLSRDCEWREDGYVMQSLFEPAIQSAFTKKIKDILFNKFCTAGLSISPDEDFSGYHRHVSQYDQHLKVINQTKLVERHELGDYFGLIEQRVSEICKKKVRSKKPMNGEEVFHFRVIRPNQADFNPLHKDIWQDENRDAINLYIPICGSNESSSLILAKGSHLLAEDSFIRSKEGATMNNIKFNVPGLISCDTDLDFVRPNPGLNEILVFSPYMIHGGSSNLNADMTRISLEMRFWRDQ